MNDIAPIGRPNMPGLERSGQPPRAGGSPTGSHRGRDAVELTPAAQMLSKLHELPEVRQDLIEKVQARIEQGRYEEPAVLEEAIEKMLVEEGVFD
ncbi:MAG: flagellar biosynthesis anti-sigma factor FlgM [Phycisphaeraceae bacterium]